MAAFPPLWALGLMSGTSLDGIDAALIRTDGETVAEAGPALTIPYDDPFRRRLAAALGRTAGLEALEAELTRRHARAAERLLAGHPGVDLVGFHGHTIDHRPAEGRTLQLGDGAMLASALGAPVVCDFRSADVAAGGQGAPLAPLFHAALAAPLAKPLAVLNVGGIANLTWIGAAAPPVAFDTGPGNALLDLWTERRTGRKFDEGGRLAAGGRADPEAVARYLAHPWFAGPPPKSLDRLDFDLAPLGAPEAADGAATLVEVTARAVALAAAHLPAPPRLWLVAGGGRRNAAVMSALARVLDALCLPVESEGWSGDALEAQAFAFLAVRSLRGLPLSLPTTTGAARPMPGGRLFRP